MADPRLWHVYDFNKHKLASGHIIKIEEVPENGSVWSYATLQLIGGGELRILHCRLRLTKEWAYYDALCCAMHKVEHSSADYETQRFVRNVVLSVHPEHDDF
jgi:hypothetical protein